MKGHLPHPPLKQAENSVRATLGKRRQLASRRELLYLLASLHPNSTKTEESSPLVNMDRAPPVLKNNVLVLYLIYPRKEESSSNFTRKKKASLTAQSTTRDLLSLLAREIRREIRELLTISSSLEKMEQNLPGLP